MNVQQGADDVAATMKDAADKGRNADRCDCCFFLIFGTEGAQEYYPPKRLLETNAMNEVHQLANAMLIVAFAAVMLVAGQWFIEYRSAKHPLVQPLLTATMPG